MFPKLNVSTRVLLTAACLIGTTAHAAVMDQILDPVYSEGFNDFFSAAQTGQADILLVGDSTVLTGGGWAYALNSGFADSAIGLAGTGLLGGRNDREGEGGGYFQVSEDRLFGTAAPVNGIRNDDDRSGNNFDFSLPPVIEGQMIGDANNPSDPTFITPFGTATASSSNNFGPAVRGIEIDGDGIASGGKFTFSVELGNAADNDIAFDVVRRFFDENGTQQTQVVASDTVAANADLSSFDFTFDTDPDYDDSASFTIQTQKVADRDFGIGLEIGSFRLRNDDVTGVTVTSWGYGGQTVDDFLTEQYQPLTEDFRQSTLNQITAGGSGELLVVISEGFNDQSAGDTPKQYVDGVLALQAAITADFVAAGNDADQLSFLAFGQYLTGRADPADEQIAAYSLALRDAALADASLSFIDLRSLTADEDLDTIVARLDGARLHFGNQTVAEFYGDALIRELNPTVIPEPATAALLLTAGGLMLTGRRRRA